jgi:hypothetical protein
MKKGILELIKKIYGSNALSKVLGTRTNVIRLPDNELKQYTNKELNIEAASDKLVQKAKADINELLAEYPQMNDAEKLIFEGNLTRLGNTLGVIEKKQGPAADVIKFGTSEKVSPEGVMSLTKKTQVTDLKTEATKRKSVDDLIDEYNANQDRLRLSDEEGGTLIGYEEYEQLRKRNKDISKALENKGISSKVEKKPEAEIIPFTNKPDPEDFATGGRVGYAKGGFLKLAMKFFNDNNPVSAYKKYLKYVKETAQKDPAKLAPEVGGIVVGSELIHRGLRRKLKEVKEKNNENDSENLETDNRTEKAGGGVSQGLDYLAGIERRGYAGGSILKTIGKKIIKKTKKSKKPTKDDYDEYREILDHPEYEVVQGNETFEQLDELVKKQKDYESYMYAQYKMGKLDPVAGEQSPARMKILQRKLEEAGATKDKRLIDADELQELDKLEKIYLKPDERSLTPSSPLINISDPEVASDFANFAKQNDPEGYKKIEDIANKINQKIELENFDITGRKKNAKGGLNYLMGL